MRTKEEILKGMDEVTFLLRCQEDFKFFAERALGITTYGGIHEFQMKWIRNIEKNKVTVIEAFPNASKTEIVGVAYPLWYLLRHQNKKVLLISKAAHQSKTNLLSRIKDYITENEVLRELWAPERKDSLWNNTQIQLKDKSLITIAPYSINVRSYRGDVIICDEADSYEDNDIFFSEVTTRLNPGGRMCLISTPKGPNKLLGVLKTKRPVGYVFIKTVALIDNNGNPAKKPYDKCISLWPERFSVQHFLDELEAQGESIFELNYLCNTKVGGDDSLFSVKNWYECFDPNISFSDIPNEEAQYFIGADFAISSGPKADFDCFVVVEKLGDQMILKWIETHKGWTRPAKVERLRELYERYSAKKTTRIIADESNMGSMVIGDLRTLGITVTAQKFHYEARKKLLITLRNVIEGKGLRIPRNKDDNRAIKIIDDLTEQLMGFSRRTSEAGTESYLSQAPHDDIAISLAMAVSLSASMRNITCLGMSRN